MSNGNMPETSMEAFQPKTDPPLAEKHSGFGIASFIISLLIGIGDFIMVAIAGIMEARTPGGIDEKSAIAIFLGLCIIGGLIVNLAGLAFGIVGLLQKNRKKVFAILGLIFNSIILLMIVVLMIIGLAIGG